MTSAPPPDSHPTGPPSGPLAAPRPSDPTQAMPRQQPAPSGQGGSPGGPEDGSGGRGGGGGGDGSGGPGDHRPWWRSAPRVALLAVVLVAAVALVVFLTRPDKKSDTSGSDSTGTTLSLQPAAAAGTDPFTQSTAKDSSEPATASPMPSLLSSGTDGAGTAEGSTPGLYGGTLKVSSCDVERQIDLLTGDAAKAKAFAGVEGIEPSEIPAYLRSLTPVQLRTDTSVTNHGFKDGKATAFQSVLQAGTAVLVGDHGEPRVRCACGNPLQSPAASSQSAKTTGQAWPSYDPAKVVTVQDAKKDVDVFVLYDAQSDQWFKRPRGDTGATDTVTERPGSIPSTPPTSTHSSTPSPHSSTTTHSPSPTPTHSTSTSPTPTPTPTTTAPTTPPPTPAPLTS
ncbi:DUF6777 domain-containing protein [Streptomyces sp. RKAG293]|uniref:DUF6777 domain-containing protein n=1 Tax=Streptomyces sp. RKAG293 TaxID=2893403 RepID=UPI00203488AB|nr:DUF6777 domain-containing protein [Streptomyces sp. RKAG293]MCM2421365.1 hypothetical protein [Streptomyces sp. RKAG293]